MTSLPVELHVAGARCVVVGGGRVAARRVRSLVTAGAAVEVVAPEVGEDLVALVAAHGLRHVERTVERGDLDPVDGRRVVLVVTATDRAEVNASVADWARSSGALVNRADDAAAGDLAFPAVVERGPLRVAVSTGGASPTVSRWAAARVDEGLDQLLGLDARGLALLVEVFAEVRAELRAAAGRPPGSSGAVGGGTRMDLVDWRSALDGSILDLIHRGRRAEAKERLLACLSS